MHYCCRGTMQGKGDSVGDSEVWNVITVILMNERKMVQDYCKTNFHTHKNASITKYSHGVILPLLNKMCLFCLI